MIETKKKRKGDASVVAWEASRPEGFVCLGIYFQTNENRLKHFAWDGNVSLSRCHSNWLFQSTLFTYYHMRRSDNGSGSRRHLLLVRGQPRKSIPQMFPYCNPTACSSLWYQKKAYSSFSSVSLISVSVFYATLKQMSTLFLIFSKLSGRLPYGADVFYCHMPPAGLY